MSIGILYQDGLKEYDFGEGHPFRGERYELFYKFLTEKLPEDNNYKILKAEPATDQDLLLICDRNYIEFTRGYYEAAAYGISYPGRFTDFHSMDNIPTGKPGKLEEAARLVVGQAKLACQLIQDGKFQKVISIGGGLHHAKQNYGEGFCLYNDIAFCARYLLQNYSLERILILDTDAHTGNGTYDYFQEEPRVLLIDIHEDPLAIYPSTGFASEIGSGAGTGYTINIPLPLYAGNDSYKLAFESIIEPVTAEFKPEIIICNGGSDPHFADTLTNLGLTVAGFRMVGEKIQNMAEVCGGRVIDLIASGYNRSVLAASWLAMIAGLAGFNVQIEGPVPIPEQYREDQILERTQQVIEEVKKYTGEYWKSLR
jgi:acetoin utilization protein AcuC